MDANAPAREEAIATRDRPDEGLYEILVDGRRAGIAAYEIAPGEIVFTHTEVDPAYGGRGLGSRLAAAALDDARERDLRVRPRCPFIARYILEHGEYRDLLRRRPTGGTDAR